MSNAILFRVVASRLKNIRWNGVKAVFSLMGGMWVVCGWYMGGIMGGISRFQEIITWYRFPALGGMGGISK